MATQGIPHAGDIPRAMYLNGDMARLPAHAGRAARADRAPDHLVALVRETEEDLASHNPRPTTYRYAVCMLMIGQRRNWAIAVVNAAIRQHAGTPQAIEFEILRAAITLGSPLLAHRLTAREDLRRLVVEAGRANVELSAYAHHLARVSEILCGPSLEDLERLDQQISANPHPGTPPAGFNARNATFAERAMIAYGRGNEQEARDLFADMMPDENLITALIFMNMHDEALDMIDRLPGGQFDQLWLSPLIENLSGHPRWDAFVERAGVRALRSNALLLSVPGEMINSAWPRRRDDHDPDGGGRPAGADPTHLSGSAASAA